MCGIAGIVTEAQGSDRQAHFREMLRGMMTMLRHRGPDGEGVVVDVGASGPSSQSQGQSQSPAAAHAYLGHRRLAILAPGPLADQPMRTPDGRFALSLNGAIYNFVELAAELDIPPALRGSDTAVLLWAWQRWGADCLGRLNGMFAFSLWDARERCLHLCRDRFGEKPLLYALPSSQGVRLAYASEAKALLSARLASPRLHAPALAEFLATHDIDHRPGETLFQDIRQIEPGCFLRLDARGDVRQHRYYRLPLPTRGLDGADGADGTRRDTEQSAELDALLQDAVRLRLRSDVPLAGSLSGGLDSSLLTALAVALRQQESGPGAASALPYPVFSCKFPDATVSGDETAWIDRVAEHLALRDTVTVSPTASDLARDLSTVLFHQEAPFADTSIVAHFGLVRAARQRGIKVLLSGQGGDEVFGGYPSYGYALLGELLRRGDIGALHKQIAAHGRVAGDAASRLLAAALYHALPPPLHEWLYARRRRGAAALSLDGLRLLRAAPPRFDAPLPALCSPPASGWDLFDRYRADSIARFSLPHILRHDDRNSMAVGVESRAPYLDHRLLEFMLRVAPTRTIGDGYTKRLLRDVARGRLPEQVRLRPDKRGFFSPQRDWLRSPACEDRVRLACASLPAPLDALMDRSRLAAQVDDFYGARGQGSGPRSDGQLTAAIWLAWVSCEFVAVTVPALCRLPDAAASP